MGRFRPMRDTANHRQPGRLDLDQLAAVVALAGDDGAATGEAMNAAKAPAGCSTATGCAGVTC